MGPGSIRGRGTKIPQTTWCSQKDVDDEAGQIMTKTEQCIWQHGGHSELERRCLVGKHGWQGESNVFESNWRKGSGHNGLGQSSSHFLLTVQMQIFCGLYEELLYQNFFL